MDNTWCVVPVTSDIMTATWLLEYIMCFVDSRVWAGRLSYSTRTHHLGADGRAHPTSFTRIPHCHNVSIPGPAGIMLVLLDESTTASNNHLPILRPAGVNVNPGSPYVQRFDSSNYLVDMTALLHNLLDDSELSSQRMCWALEWIEANMCTDMAFQLAFSLASELSAGLPESPTLEVAPEPNHRYQHPLNGAWTIVSPLLQYSQSTARVEHRAIVEDDRVVAYSSHWQSFELEADRPQYQCHTAHSVYRVMLALGLIEKNDYKMELRTVGGLQSMLVLKAAAITLSVALYLTHNDMDRWMWSSLYSEGTSGVVSAQNKLRTVTLNYVIPLSAHHLMQRASRTGSTVGQDITAYYGLDINRNQWALSIPMPIFAVLQWAAKFDIRVYAEVVGVHGNVKDNYCTMHVEVTPSTRYTMPWYTSTGNTFSRIPRLLSILPRGTPSFIPISIDDWAVQTPNAWAPEPLTNGFVSMVTCTSLRYHYRDVDGAASLLVLNPSISNVPFSRTFWGVSPTEYPDPPNLPFLYKAVANAGTGQQSVSQVVELENKKPPGPTQARPSDPPPMAPEATKTPMVPLATAGETHH
ncbi:unnamed protein product [Parnassius apollo]|uniref:(apollo) hypothetical protein n=1 Tax=Parnassius apollo TaxID=110799 RepID=A0A8S3X5T7_PARAO|nr:unnamed protein product [Parnassius apollo]